MEQLNRAKFKELVHYVCHKADDDPSCLGAIKLNKVLWYSDSIFYVIHGRSITGETYVKRQHGPVPQHILPALNELIAEKKVARGHVDHFGYMKTEYITIEEPDISSFSGAEIAIVDEAFDHVCLKNTATSISEETHGVIWQIAAMGERIPLATVFASDVGEVDEDDVAWATERLGVPA